MVEYNKERTAALIRDAREITRHLKVEVDGLTRQLARVLDGGEDEAGEGLGRQKIAAVPDAAVVERAKAKSSWLFWR